mgnify:CR=1 FL=1|jgi:hypothetical protein
MSGDRPFVRVGGTVEVLEIGIQGPQGAPGESLIGGYFVSVSNLSNDDLIKFDSATQKWVNVKKDDVLNGGNF